MLHASSGLADVILGGQGCYVCIPDAKVMRRVVMRMDPQWLDGA